MLFYSFTGWKYYYYFWIWNYTAQSVWNLKSCCCICKKNIVLMSYSREYSYSPIPPPTPLCSLSSFLALYIIFMKAQFFHVNLRFKRKKMKKCCIYNHGDMYLFHFTYTCMQIILHSADFAGDKYVALNFSDACFFVRSDYFDHQDFLSFASAFSL